MGPIVCRLALRRSCKGEPWSLRACRNYKFSCGRSCTSTTTDSNCEQRPARARAFSETRPSSQNLQPSRHRGPKEKPLSFTFWKPQQGSSTTAGCSFRSTRNERRSRSRRCKPWKESQGQTRWIQSRRTTASNGPWSSFPSWRTRDAAATYGSL